MASATPTAAMNAAMATSSTGAALDFFGSGATNSVGRGFFLRLPLGPGGGGSSAGGASNGLRARGGGERCSVVRASSGGGTGSNGLRRFLALGAGPIGVGTLATGAPRGGVGALAGGSGLPVADGAGGGNDTALAGGGAPLDTPSGNTVRVGASSPS